MKTFVKAAALLVVLPLLAGCAGSKTRENLDANINGINTQLTSPFTSSKPLVAMVNTDDTVYGHHTFAVPEAGAAVDANIDDKVGLTPVQAGNLAYRDAKLNGRRWAKAEAGAAMAEAKAAELRRQGTVCQKYIQTLMMVTFAGGGPDYQSYLIVCVYRNTGLVGQYIGQYRDVGSAFYGWDNGGPGPAYDRRMVVTNRGTAKLLNIDRDDYLAADEFLNRSAQVGDCLQNGTVPATGTMFGTVDAKHPVGEKAPMCVYNY